MSIRILVSHLFARLARSSDGELHRPPSFRSQARDLRLGLGDRQPERLTRSHDHRRHPFQPSW